jgi:fatty-acyl-CoA synthase
MSAPGRRIRVDDRGVVSVGRPFPGVEVAILDAGGERTEAGTAGEIAVRGSAVTAGYYRNEPATLRLFRRDGFLLTGDLGYLDAAGELFVVGRRKNIIIHAGRNVAPREIEEIADRVEGVRASAAVGVDRGRTEGEQVYVFAEVRGRPVAEAHQATAVAIVGALHAELGLRPGRLYLVKPRAVPRTANGKLRHAELKSRYTGGRLRQEGWILFPDY